MDISVVAGHKGLESKLGCIPVADKRLHEAAANIPTLATLQRRNYIECTAKFESAHGL